ncbi:MAG: hypothetical protein EOP83_24805 [Verrucomicrobiaceae bacterium]|nr:MAG: hypothetical protein EOP83_24805 [Verrucomicrobiaceae bacterium]
MREAARFDINYVLGVAGQGGGGGQGGQPDQGGQSGPGSQDKALLRTLFVDWGLELEVAQEVADALTDWVDKDDDESLNGAEKSYYEKEGRINQPFNRAFADLSEMSLVKGMDLVEAVRPDWRNFFTVHSQTGLDLNDAEAELIAAATDVPIEQAELIPEKVRGPDGILYTTDDVPFKDVDAALNELGISKESRPDIGQRVTTGTTVTRIESIGFAEGAKRKITVIVGNRSGKPALLERTEEIIP